MMMEAADHEMMMTAVELGSWIRDRVEKMPLISPAVLENCHILQSLLERRERQAACLLKLCKSLAACEEIVRKQYALLGWEYRDRHSNDDDDDDDITGCGDALSSPCESVHSENNEPIPVMNSTPLPQSKKHDFKRTREEVKLNCLSQKRKLAVVLTRLPECKLRALPLNIHSVNVVSRVPPNERTNTTQNTDKPAKQPNPVRISRPRTLTCARAQRRLKRMSSHRANKETETSSLSADSKDVAATSVCSGSTLCKSAETREVLLNMKVLARRKMLNWQRGRIVKIVEKENGKLKYKVCFEERGKGLVSGHHIAFDVVPEVDQLGIGSRVVVRCENSVFQFMPGVVAELPSETNRSRFLIFIDDHTSIYVSVHILRLVFQPMVDSLDDISDPVHKAFMQEYITAWPSYPHYIHYKVGQTINVELDGVQQKCEVIRADCSLIQVAFQDAHEEWIYRGSMRLQHFASMKKRFETQKNTSA